MVRFGCLFIIMVLLSSGDVYAQHLPMTLIIDKKDTYAFDTLMVKGVGKVFNPAAELVYTCTEHPVTYTIDHSSQKQDTVYLGREAGPVLVEHTYHGFCKQFAFLYPGDTVYITYHEGKPRYKWVNRPDSTFDYDQAVDAAGIRSVAMAKKLSIPVAAKAFYIDRIRELGTTHGSYGSPDIRLRLRKAFYEYISASYTHQFAFPDAMRNASLQDSFLLFNFFRTSLAQFADTFRIKGARLSSSNRSTLDYRVIYDSIAKSPAYSKNSRNYLLSRCVEIIAENFSRSDFLRYSIRLRRDVTDTTLIQSTLGKYLLQARGNDAGSGDLLLLDGNKNSITLDQLLQKCRGKVIFVDFWASWCLPCREAMPASRILRAAFKSDSVIFVFLSIDKDFSAWKRANKEEGLDRGLPSFILSGAETSDLFKQLKFSTIPRYIIFDRKGRLVYQNAQGPGSPETDRFIKELLYSN